MRALIDCDLLCYEIGSLKLEDGWPAPWQYIEMVLCDRITKIIESTEAGSWQGYLTGKGNFRESVATIRPYKGNRDRSQRPFWYQGVFNYLKNERNVEVIEGMEADDAISIEGANEPAVVMCSRDKDFKQVPGWHYEWSAFKEPDKDPYWIDELDALRFHYTQLLTGDTADNIPGLYNVGPKSAAVKKVQEAQSEQQMFQIVKDEYELRFGSYWEQFMSENGRLLWILKHEDDDWYDRQRELWEQQKDTGSLVKTASELF